MKKRHHHSIAVLTAFALLLVLGASSHAQTPMNTKEIEFRIVCDSPTDQHAALEIQVLNNEKKATLLITENDGFSHAYTTKLSLNTIQALQAEKRATPLTLVAATHDAFVTANKDFFSKAAVLLLEQSNRYPSQWKATLSQNSQVSIHHCWKEKGHF